MSCFDSDGYFRSEVFVETESEAVIVADKVRSLPDPLELAWKDVRAEYDTQDKIWHSLATLRGYMQGGNEHHECVLDDFRKDMEAIFELATEDYEEPIDDLDTVLNNKKYQEIGFSKAFEVAAQGVLYADSVASKRQRLIDHLDEDLDELVPERDDYQDLETLLLECEFHDCKLEYRIRQVLRLGVRSALHQHHPDTQLTVRRVRFQMLDDYDDPDDNESTPPKDTRVSDGTALFVRTDGTVSI